MPTLPTIEAGPSDAAILVIARNNLALTKKAVNSALATGALVVVIDNASDDNTSSWLRTKGVVSMFYSRTQSLAACWNAGLKFLFDRIKLEAVLVLNNDVEIRPDALSLLLAHGGPFVTGVSVDHRSKMGVPGDREIEDLRAKERRHPDFSCWAIRRSVIERLGYFFDEACWPAYCEDSFAHIKLHRAGIHAVCIDVPFYHASASTLKHAPPAESAEIKRGAQANRERFKAKYGCYPGSEAYEKLFTAG